MQAAYIILALSNFANGFLVRNNTPADSITEQKNSSIFHSIDEPDSLFTKQRDVEPNEREHLANNGNKTFERLNYLLRIDSQNNKHISNTKRETDYSVNGNENKTLIKDIQDILLINDAIVKHKEINQRENEYKSKKLATNVAYPSDKNTLMNQSVTKNETVDKNDNLRTKNVPNSEHTEINNGDDLNNAKSTTTVKLKSEETDRAKVISEEVINVRSRRSSSGFFKLLKKFFVKSTKETATSTTTISTMANENVNTTPTPITRQTLADKNMNDAEKMKDDENDGMIVDKRYLDDLLCKLDKVLQILSEKVTDEEYTDDTGYITIKIPLALDVLRKNRLKRGVESTKLTKDKPLNNVNATEKRNDTKTIKEISQQIDLELKKVQDEIAPIKGLKDEFSSNKIYKIGYIIANLETLELTLKKMVDKNSSTGWSETQAQKILDKITLSKEVVLNLMRHLDMYSKSKSK